MKSAIVLFLFFCLSGLAQAQTSSPRIAADGARHDFGRAKAGVTLQHSFSLENTGSAPLNFGAVRLMGKGLTASVPKSIAPGGTGTVRLQIETGKLVGPWEWRVNVLTNDPSRRAVEFVAVGHIFRPLEIEPRRLFFSVFENQTTMKSVRITKHDGDPLAVRGIETEGSHFKATLKEEAPGRKYTLEIVVPKDGSPGRYREAVLLRTDDPQRPVLRITVNVLIKGEIFIDPEALDFGRVRLSALQNETARDLQMQTFLIKKRSSKFRITRATSDIRFLEIALAPRGQQSDVFRVDVRLNPSTAETGSFEGTLVLFTDDSSHPKISISVRGEVR